MRQILKIALILNIVMLLLISCQTGKTDLEFTEKFETQAKQIFKDKQLAGDFLFAVVNENGLIYSFALNRDILNGKKSDLNNHSPIYIASHTKSFTATLLKILEEQKKIDLNKTVYEYLPELTFNDKINTKEINIRSLLNHTHGTFSPRLTWKTAFLGYSGKNSEMIDDLNNDYRHDPSSLFRYSNVGSMIAALVLEKKVGNSWKDEMRKQIFEPLEMNETSSNVSDFDFKTIRPSVIVNQETSTFLTGFYKSNITMHAAGGTISTINDLSKWLAVNIRQDTKLLSKTGWADLHAETTKQDRTYFTYKRNAYSLGWDIASYQNETILTRFGGLAGISFHISFMPEKKMGIIAFSTDNRATRLPHLMANYAYNQVNNLKADSIFLIEKEIFDEGYEKQNNRKYPKKDELLTSSVLNDKIIGSYLNKETWPIITIKAEDHHYTIYWGVLNGQLYKTEKGGYIAYLGALSREFEIDGDILKTGSLIYNKIK
jgi:CubicO group peptidase (beta-lactamase class C family)